MTPAPHIAREISEKPMGAALAYLDAIMAHLPKDLRDAHYNRHQIGENEDV